MPSKSKTDKSVLREYIVMIAGIALVFVFLFFTRRLLSPLWFLVGTVIIVWPYRKKAKIFKIILGIALLFFFVYLLLRLGGIAYSFLGAGLIAYVFSPLVDWLEKRRISRSVGSLIIILGISAGIIGIFFGIIPPLINEFREFYKLLVTILTKTNVNLDAINAKLASLGIKIEFQEIWNRILPNIQNIVLSSISGIYRGIATTIKIILLIGTSLLMGYYGLKNWKMIGIKIKENVKKQEKGTAYLSILEDIEIALSRYIRSRLLLASIVGVMIGLSLFLLKIRYSLLLGIIAGIFQLIPHIGYILSIIPAVIVGLVNPEPLITIVKIGAVYAGQQLLENYVMGPQITGKALGLNPGLVVIAVVIGGTLGGIIGVLIAPPVAAIIKVLWNHRKTVVKLI